MFTIRVISLYDDLVLSNINATTCMIQISPVLVRTYQNPNNMMKSPIKQGEISDHTPAKPS